MGWKTLCELQEWTALATFERREVAVLHVARQRRGENGMIVVYRFAPIDPNSERSPFWSVSGLSDLAVVTICESPRSSNDHRRRASTT